MGDFTDRSQFRVGDLLVVPRRLVVIRHGKEISLERRMMQVLVMLAENAGETLTKEQLLAEIWRSTIYGDSPVNKTVSLLRERIGDDARKPKYIKTHSKIGYEMIAEVALPENYRRTPSEPWTQGNPYVGLSAFDATHSAVFYGRSRIVGNLLHAMRAQIENKRRFVLLVGASGCGKTSLLHAGAIPLLTKADGFDGLRALSVASCDLAKIAANDPLMPLIEALASWRTDRPVFPPQTSEQLKSMLIKTPNSIASFVEEALRREALSEPINQPLAHFLLTIDHAESLVATNDFDTASLEVFASILSALCNTPRVLVTMITRGDFYLKLMEAFPMLVDRKSGDGHIDVMTPREGEIAEIIRSPAWKADLGFEMNPETRIRLDDALRDAAIAQPDALPLLQHTLHTLYERRNDQKQLTFVAYNAIDGLEGAIAHRAEEIFATLPGNVQASLGKVLAKIVIIQPDSDAVSAHRAYTDSFKDEARTLIDAFISNRLFVGDRSGGRATIGVAHEALLRRWPRAAEWIRNNRRILMARSHFQRAAARWAEEGRRDDHLLNSGRQLEEGKDVADSFSADLSDEERIFLLESKKMHRRRHQLKIASVSLLAIMTIFSSALSAITMHSRKQAEEQRDSLVKQSFAFRSVGEMVFNNADIRGAEAAFLAVNENLRIAHEANPESEGILAEYGVWSYWLGYFYDQNGQAEKAEPHWIRYLEISRKLHMRNPASLAWKMDLSYALNNIGNLRKKKLIYDEALKYFLDSERIKREVMQLAPESEDLTYDYIDTLSWIGSTEESIGNLRSANAHYLQLIDIAQDLVSRNSDNNTYKRKLGNELWRYARLSSAMGARDQALKSIDQSIFHLRELASREPSNKQFSRDLSNALLESGIIAADAGDSALSASRIRLAKIEIDKIQMGPETRPSWLRLRATINFHFGVISTGKKRHETMDNAINELSSLADSHPSETQIIIDLAKTRIIRGKIHALSGDITAATKDWQWAKTKLDRMATRTQDHTILTPWVHACTLLGEKGITEPHINFLLDNGHAEVKP